MAGKNLLVRVEYFLGDHNQEITSLLLSEETKSILTGLLGELPTLFKEKVNYKLPWCRPDNLLEYLLRFFYFHRNCGER